MLVVLLSLPLTPFQIPVQAQGSDCSASGPASAAYAVTICITDPINGAVLTRESSVTATVSVTGTNPGAQKLVFYLGGQYLLTHYTSPYTFIIPTAKFVDGGLLLEVEAIMRDGLTLSRAAINVILDNDSSPPPVNTDTFTPSAEQIIHWFVRRWQVEISFHEARTFLGVEMQRQWADLLILRITPALPGLFSLITLLANLHARKQNLPEQQTAWYPKKLPTFSDALALVKETLFLQDYFRISLLYANIRKPPATHSIYYFHPSLHTFSRVSFG